MEPFMFGSSWKFQGAKRGAVVDLEKLLKEPSRSFGKPSWSYCDAFVGFS